MRRCSRERSNRPPLAIHNILKYSKERDFQEKRRYKVPKKDVSNVIICNNFDIIKFEHSLQSHLPHATYIRRVHTEKRGPRIHQPFTYSILHHQFQLVATEFCLFWKPPNWSNFFSNEKDISLRERCAVVFAFTAKNLEKSLAGRRIKIPARSYLSSDETAAQCWHAFSFIQSATAALHFLQPE